MKAAQEVLALIKGDYEGAYYQGIVWERFGNARIRHAGTGAGASAYHALREAMDKSPTFREVVQLRIMASANPPNVMSPRFMMPMAGRSCHGANS